MTWAGLGDGDAVGICMPGVITCPGLGDGDAVGICMPGVMTCGLAEGDGLGLAVLLVGVRRARGAGRFLGAARLGLALGFAAGLGMTCPSCCGNALVVNANIKASTPSVRSVILKLLDRIMIPPNVVRQSERCRFSNEIIDV